MQSYNTQDDKPETDPLYDVDAFAHTYNSYPDPVPDHLWYPKMAAELKDANPIGYKIGVGSWFPAKENTFYGVTCSTSTSKYGNYYLNQDYVSNKYNISLEIPIRLSSVEEEEFLDWCHRP